MSEQTIVVGWTPDPYGAAAVAHAVAEARLRGDRILVVNATRGDALVDERYAGDERAVAPRGRARGRRRGPRDRGSRWAATWATRCSRLADEVDASLVVIGLRRRTPGRQADHGQRRAADPDGRALPRAGGEAGGGLTARVRSRAPRPVILEGAHDDSNPPRLRRTPVRRPRDPRVRPQRGRLRGARRSARGRRLPARRRRRPTPTPSWSTPAASSRPPRRTPSTPCSRPPTSRTTGRTQAVVAVGCLAERYGKDLADSLPEADAVLGFDDYPDIAARLRSIVAGETPPGAHPAGPAPAAADLPGRPRRDRRSRARAHGRRARPAAEPVRPATGPRAVRRRLDGGPMAPLKLASGCDRRCSFCAIPSFRGSFVSRRPSDVLAEARWLAAAGRARALPGQRELHVVRQGPRRPAAARDAAARAGRDRRHRAGARVLPPARRDPARA